MAPVLEATQTISLNPSTSCAEFVVEARIRIAAQFSNTGETPPSICYLPLSLVSWIAQASTETLYAILVTTAETLFLVIVAVAGILFVSLIPAVVCNTLSRVWM